MVLKPYELTQWTFQKQNNILEKTSRHSLIFDAARRNIWQVNATYLRTKLKFLSAQYFLFVLFLFILSKLTCWTYLFSKLKSQCVWNRRLVFSLWGMFCSDLRSDLKPFRVLRSLRISKISKIHLNTIELIVFRYYFCPTCEFAFILFRGFVEVD